MRLLGHRESLNATYSRIRMWELETHLQRRCSTPTDPTVLVTRPRHPWETMEPLTVFPMVHQTQGLNSRENHCLNQGDLQLETISELRQIRSQNQFFSRRRTKLIKSRLFPTWLAAASKWEVHKRKIMPSNLEHLLSLSLKEVWTNQITDWLPRCKRLLRPTQIEPCLLRLLPESALATPNRCPLLGRRLDSWIPQLGRKRMWSHTRHIVWFDHTPYSPFKCWTPRQNCLFTWQQIESGWLHGNSSWPVQNYPACTHLSHTEFTIIQQFDCCISVFGHR
jgi:hypothetical protein